MSYKLEPENNGEYVGFNVKCKRCGFPNCDRQVKKDTQLCRQCHYELSENSLLEEEKMKFLKTNHNRG